jgi:serine/threonine protein kinase
VDHPNIIPLHEVILPQSFEKFTDVYFVTELMEADLRDLFESNMTLETEHVRYMTYQLICAVNHLHQCDIIHRDIKPENILINSDCSLRLCDLGLARGCLFEGRDEHLEKTTRLSTNYVQTRPYRAPELILNSNRVGKSSDMWAVGCILAEMLNNGEILFNGQSNQEQIFTIIQTMGTPSPASLHGSTAGIEFVNKLEYVQPNPEWYLEVFPRHSTDQMALDLLSRLLQFDFQKRISAREALEHPFFDSCRDPKHYNTVTKTFNFDFERKLVVSDEEAIITYGNLVKKECYDTILKFHGIVEKQEESKTDTATTKAPSIFNKMKSFLKKNKV